MSTFTKIRDAVEGFFSGPIWDFVKPFISIIESQGGAILITAAENAVIVGASAGGGQAAMAAALASFSAEVVAKGVPFVESQARAMIELALQKAKTNLLAASTPGVEPIIAAGGVI